MTHSDTVAGKVDLTGIINPTATLTVNGVAAARQGEYFHRAVDVSNGSAPVDQSISVTSNYGSTQTVTENIYVPKSAEVYTYDDGGNLLSDGRWNYTWDAENRLIEMDTIAGVPTSAEKRIEFEYDYKGRSIRKKVYEPNGGGETLVLERKYLFDGWNLQAELDGSDAVIRKYLWGPDLSGTTHGAGGVGGLLMICDIPSYGNKDYYFVGADGNGNVTVLVDADAGTVEGRYEYGPFGESLRVTGSAIAGENPFRFSSKYTDTESGFLYYGFRYYNPETGRWLNRDPIEEEGGTNLVLFINNDPLTNVDALGEIPLDTVWDIGWIIYDIAVGDYVSLTADVAALATPYVPAGTSRLVKGAVEVEKVTKIQRVKNRIKIKVGYEYVGRFTRIPYDKHFLRGSGHATRNWVQKTRNGYSKWKPATTDDRVKQYLAKALKAAKSEGKIKPSEIDNYIFDLKNDYVGASKGCLTSKIRLHIGRDGKGLHAFPVPMNSKYKSK